AVVEGDWPVAACPDAKANPAGKRASFEACGAVAAQRVRIGSDAADGRYRAVELLAEHDREPVVVERKVKTEQGCNQLQPVAPGQPLHRKETPEIVLEAGKRGLAKNATRDRSGEFVKPLDERIDGCPPSRSSGGLRGSQQKLVEESESAGVVEYVEHALCQAFVH